MPVPPFDRNLLLALYITNLNFRSILVRVDGVEEDASTRSARQFDESVVVRCQSVGGICLLTGRSCRAWSPRRRRSQTLSRRAFTGTFRLSCAYSVRERPPGA